MSRSLTLFSETVLQGPVGEEALKPLRLQALSCVRCNLSQGRKNAVFGEGLAERPQVMFVGESPGAQEDALGKPFVGPAGILLTRMIEAMGLKRADVYVCNVVCCHPPNNRRPLPEEIGLCSEYLLGQIRAVRPLVIVALGGTAAHALLKGAKASKGIRDLRGKWFEVEGIPACSTYHPAFLLRPEGREAKKDTWLDLQAIQVRLRELNQALGTNRTQPL